MRRWLALALLLAAAPLLAPSEAQALRCGTDLIDVGDTRAEVRAKCGEPLDVARRVVTQTIRQRVAAGAAVMRTVSTVVETWTMNFGPQKLMQEITFANGQVQHIRTLDRGFREDRLGGLDRPVRLGDTPSQVRSAWGAPTDTSRRVEDRTVAQRLDDLTAAATTVSVEVEVWIFNFGPRRFMRQVTFVDGRVESVETLSRGFVDGD